MSKDQADLSNSNMSGPGRDADFGSDEGSEVENTGQASSNQANKAGASGSNANSDEIAKLKIEVEQAKDKYLRALADFDNFQKRAARERAELIKYQGDKILLDVLDVVDNFERAIGEAEKKPESLREGVPLIYKLFVDVLGKWGVKGESAVGKQFDPAIHRALSQVPLDDTKPGTVVNEMRKPYFYKDRLLRVGEVVVAAAREKDEKGE